MLQQARDELEERVIQRTAELATANRQLTAEIAERQRSETRFRSLAENSPDFIYIRDVAAESIALRQSTQFAGSSERTRSCTMTVCSSWCYPADQERADRLLAEDGPIAQTPVPD